MSRLVSLLLGGLLLGLAGTVPVAALQLISSGGGLPAPGGEGTCLTISGGTPAWTSCLTEGSTGIASATANGVLYATGVSTATSTGAMTNGQLLIGRSGNTPVPATITGTAPISITNGSGSITVAIVNAAADGSTKGAVAFVADDFTCTTGVCGIDYANAQTASAAQPGFLSAGDWDTFNTKQDALGYTAEDTANKSTNTALGSSDTLYPTQKAVKTYVDNAVPTIVGGAGIAVSGATVSTALTEAGAVPDGTAAALTCGTTNGGMFQIGPGQVLQYCDYAEALSDPEDEESPLIPASVLRSGHLTQDGLSWGVTVETCSTDSNGGKLTVIANTIVCAQDLGGSDELWPDGGVTSLTCAGAQGAHQVMNTGRLQYCGGEDSPVLYDGYLLPTPLSFNITAGTCTGDSNGGKLTINGSNQVVCAADVGGEGGGGSGDISAVGNITSGDAGTTGFPFTSVWFGVLAAPSAPATGQGRLYLDETSKNLAIVSDDSAVKHMVQTAAPVANQVVTGISADGAVTQAQLASTNLSDSASLVTLTGAQILEGKQKVARICQLGATSGSVTPNADLCDIVYRYDVAGQLDLQTPTATGSNPRHGQVLVVVLKAASAQQTLTWTSAYDDGFGYALPALTPATVADKIAVNFYYDSVTAKWELWGLTEPSPDVVVATSSTVGQIPRITGAQTYAWGALNLADTDAVTGILPNANTTAASANTVSAIVARDGSGNFSAGTITAALAGNASTATALAVNPSACGAGDFVTDIAADGTLTCDTPAGGGTGTIHLSVGGYNLPASDPATLYTANAVGWLELQFDNTTRQCALWQGRMNADYASGLTLKAPFKTSVTSGSFHLDVRLMVATPGSGVSMDAASFDSNNDCNDAAVPGTAQAPDEISCALSNNDSIAAGLMFLVEICRDVANDNAAAKVSLIHPVLEYTR